MQMLTATNQNCVSGGMAGAFANYIFSSADHVGFTNNQPFCKISSVYRSRRIPGGL